MNSPRQNWTDEVFRLYIQGDLDPLSSRDVCRAIDWIADRPAMIEEIGASDPQERNRRLMTIVRSGAKHARRTEVRSRL